MLALTVLPITCKSFSIGWLIMLADVGLLVASWTPGIKLNRLLTSSLEMLVLLRVLTSSKVAAGMVSGEQDSRCWRLHVSLYLGGRSV